MGVAGAAQTPKIDDLRPAQQPCIKNPSISKPCIKNPSAVDTQQPMQNRVCPDPRAPGFRNLGLSGPGYTRGQQNCLRFGPPTGQTLRGLKFVIYIFIFLRSVPKTQSATEWDLDLVSGADFWRNLRSFSSRGRSRGSRGPPCAPRGRQSAENLGPDLSFDPP